ncbi:hypothetical protein AB0J52_11075 [Spirillospora sp. NPDC049652]
MRTITGLAATAVMAVGATLTAVTLAGSALASEKAPADITPKQCQDGGGTFPLIWGKAPCVGGSYNGQIVDTTQGW